MDMLDVLYTPLDIPLCPEIDIDKLYWWIYQTYPQKELLRQTSRYWIGHDRMENYPWDSTFCKHNYKWLNNFDTLFPEIKNYLLEGFGLEEHEYSVMGMIPARKESVGFGFWHTDPDYLGLRFYFCFDDLENNGLYLKKVKNKEADESYLYSNFDLYMDLLEEETIKAEIYHPRQAFYLNNIKSGHSVYNSKPGRRCAVIIGTNYSPIHDKENKFGYLRERYNELVVRSALKFKEAILLKDTV